MSAKQAKQGRRPRRLAGGIALLGLLVGVFVLAQAAPATTELKVATAADLGAHVTDASGRSLYLFLNDTTNVSNCDAQCIVNWPPVLVADENSLPQVEAPMDAKLLGVAEREGGSYQLTYNGWPLYYYAADTAAGATGGQGVGGNWYLVTPQGSGVGIAETDPGGGAPGSAM